MSIAPQLTLRPSRCYVCILSLIYTGALVCLCIAAAPLALKIPAALLLLCLAKQHIYDRSLLRHAQAIIDLHADQNGIWHLYKRNETDGQQATLSGTSVVTPWFVVLHFQPRTTPIVIWFDSLDTTTFRRLRVYLRTTSSLATPLRKANH